VPRQCARDYFHARTCGGASLKMTTLPFVQLGGDFRRRAPTATSCEASQLAENVSHQNLAIVDINWAGRPSPFLLDDPVESPAITEPSIVQVNYGCGDAEGMHAHRRHRPGVEQASARSRRAASCAGNVMIGNFARSAPTPALAEAERRTARSPASGHDPGLLSGGLAGSDRA